MSDLYINLAPFASYPPFSRVNAERRRKIKIHEPLSWHKKFLFNNSLAQRMKNREREEKKSGIDVSFLKASKGKKEKKTTYLFNQV